MELKPTLFVEKIATENQMLSPLSAHGTPRCHATLASRIRANGCVVAPALIPVDFLRARRKARTGSDIDAPGPSFRPEIAAGLWRRRLAGMGFQIARVALFSTPVCRADARPGRMRSGHRNAPAAIAVWGCPGPAFTPRGLRQAFCHTRMRAVAGRMASSPKGAPLMCEGTAIPRMALRCIAKCESSEVLKC